MRAHQRRLWSEIEASFFTFVKIREGAKCLESIVVTQLGRGRKRRLRIDSKVRREGALNRRGLNAVKLACDPTLAG